MQANLQRRIQRYGWDKALGHYERFWQQQLAPAQRLLLEMAALRPGERVLDVACGTGLVTLPAARAVGPDGAVVATDLSQGMVDQLRATVGELGLDHVEGRRQDSEDPVEPAGSFDVALCGLGMMYFPDPVASMRAQWTALRPGGRAVSAVWGARPRCGWAEIFPIVDARVRSEVCPMFFQQGGGETQKLTFEAAGFEDVRSERITTFLHYDSDEDALGAAFAGGPVALAYSRFDDVTREEAHAEYLASIADYRNGHGYEVPGEFVVTWGRK